MPIEAARVAVTTSATRLTSAVSTATAGTITITNRGAAAVFLGGPDVTTATGYQLDAAATINLNANTAGGDAVYGIVATGSETCHVLRGGR